MEVKGVGGENMENDRWTASQKKTDRQIHREKDNTLARKPKGSHYVGESTVKRTQIHNWAQFLTSGSRWCS